VKLKNKLNEEKTGRVDEIVSRISSNAFLEAEELRFMAIFFNL